MARTSLSRAGAYFEQREVAGAAAEVADEDGFRAGERGLVGGGRGERFELEGDVLEAGAGEGGAQSGEREGFVRGRLGTDEADGPAYVGGADGVAPVGFSACSA